MNLFHERADNVYSEQETGEDYKSSEARHNLQSLRNLFNVIKNEIIPEKTPKNVTNTKSFRLCTFGDNVKT